MNYFDALRKYNAGKQAWCSPRKGTPEYDAVMKIKNGGSGAGTGHEGNGAKPKRKYVKKAKAPPADDAPAKPKRKYVRKPKPPVSGSGGGGSGSMGGMVMPPKPKRKYVRKAKAPDSSGSVNAPNTIARKTACYDEFGNLKVGKRKYVRKVPVAKGMGSASIEVALARAKRSPLSYDPLNVPLPLSASSRTSVRGLSGGGRSGQYM
jgi:hypothetical protein